MALKTTHPDGRQTHWWRNKEAKDYCGKYPSVTSASGSVEDIQAAIAELEAIKQSIQKHLASTKRHRYALDAEVQSDHLPKASLRRLASLLLSDAYAEVSDKRRKQLMLVVGRMERIFGGDIDVRTIDWEMRCQYRQELIRLWNEEHVLGCAHYCSPTLQSTKSDQDCISEVLKLAQKMKLIETVPAGLTGQKDKQKKLVINEQELAAICSQMMLASVKESHPHQPKIYCALSWFEFHTAVRSAEALALEWDHIDWETETMSFYNTKNGETKVLPIFPEVVPLLQEMKALNLPRPFPVTGNGYRSAFATARQKAWDAGLLPGINEELLPELTPHIMRHSAITAMANTEGATEHMVMALSGHKSPQVARRYMRTNKATMDMLRRLKERQSTQTVPA